MVPFGQVVTADVNSDNAILMETLREAAYTRVPVFKKSRKNIVGFINIYDVLAGGEKFDSLERFVEPTGRVLAATSVLDAITQMLRHNHKIMLVTPDYEHGKKANVLGIVTMKDLVEELTGELTPWQD
jgi:CBS domain containing-hemolysin-like protein